jgi:predicted lysophospholipase L1 biosynthesis ABC-type transport system permease subunit
MRYVLLLLTLAAPCALADGDLCNIWVSFAPNNPQRFAIHVPRDECKPYMKSVLALVLYKLEEP